MSPKKIQLLVFAPSLYFSFYFNAKIRVFKFLKFHVERLCRCEGNMDSQGEFMRLVVCVFARNVYFFVKAVACCLNVHGAQSPASDLRRSTVAQGWRDKFMDWSSGQAGLLVLSLTICLTFSLVSSKTLTLCQF